jgi:arylsulfatase A-like enzyme
MPRGLEPEPQSTADVPIGEGPTIHASHSTVSARRVDAPSHLLHRRLIPLERAAPGLGRAPAWGDLLAAAVAVGVMSGLLELAVVMVQVHVLHIVGWSTLMISRHAIWMIPATGMAVVVPLALGLVAPTQMLAAYRVRRQPEEVAPGPAWDWAGLVLGTLLLLGPLLAVQGFHPIAPVAVAMGAGSRIRGLIVRPTTSWRRRVRGGVAIGIGVLVLLAASQWRAGASVPGPSLANRARRAPNLLWIVVDTLRADRMSLYGYRRPTTPELEAWAKAGMTFDMARSTAPWTLPSHISMFTGLWPSEHGACIDQSYRGPSPTLAEHLRSQGYRTAGITANVRMCNTAYGVGRGFDHYVDYPWRDEVSLKAALSNSTVGFALEEMARRAGLPTPNVYPFDYRQTADVIAAKGRAWLDSAGSPDRGHEAGSDAPFFLFLNFMDVHGPYLPSAKAAGRFADGPAPTKHNARPEDGWRAIQARDSASAEQRPRRQQELDAVSRRLSDLYDECLVGLDAELGRFLAGLREAGLLADTWVVITGDHGEHFGEHGHFGHGSSLYNEQTHVPLILIPPLGDGRTGGDPYRDLRGRRVGVPVSLRDLPATMTDVMLPGGVSPFPGRSLARHWHSDLAERPDPVLSELDQPRLKGEDFRTQDVTRIESLIDEDHILIEYGNHTSQLFALFEDPYQVHNLADQPEEGTRRQRMRKVLDVLHHRAGSGSSAP